MAEEVGRVRSESPARRDDNQEKFFIVKQINSIQSKKTKGD